MDRTPGNLASPNRSNERAMERRRLIEGRWVRWDEERARVAGNYGANYLRLQQLKRHYDPDNQFRLNANVVPA